MMSKHLATTRTTIRVDMSELFHVTYLFYELTRIHNKFVQFVDADAIDPLTLQKEAQHWQIIVSELQETVRKMRMVSIGQLLNRFPRIVKDLAKKHMKQVTLEIEGQDIEVDKVVFDAIAGSVLNLIRYSLDHGIESPDVRRQHGKPPRGTISLKAYYQEENAYIEISDDGAGLERRKTNPQTGESGNSTEESAERKQLNFILEILESCLNKIGGNFEVQTAHHQGTTVRLCLPRLFKENQSKDMAKNIDKDWQIIVATLSKQHVWKEMWRLITEAPLKWGIRLLLRLKDSEWQPERDAERATFNSLVRLAEKCNQTKVPIPGKFIHSYATLQNCNLLAVSPDGSTLVSSTRINQEESGVQLWNLHDGSIYKTLKGHTSVVFSAAFTPDGQVLATGSWDQTVRLWSFPDGNLLKVLTGATSRITGLRISPDGKILVVVERNGMMWLRSLPDGKVIKQLEATFFVFSSDGKMLAIIDRKEGLSVWNILDDRILITLKGFAKRLYHFILSPDEQLLAGAEWGNDVWIWRLPDGELLHILEGHYRSVLQIVMSPDGRQLVTLDENCIGRLWDVSSGMLLKTLEGWHHSFTISTDGRILAGGDRSDGSVRLWSLPDGTLLKRLTGHVGSVIRTAISPDKRILISDGNDRTVRLWRLGWLDMKQAIIKQTTEEDLEFVEKSKQDEEMSEEERIWLEFLSVLIRRDLSIQAQKILSLPQNLPGKASQVGQLLHICSRADDPAIAVRTYHYLASFDHPHGFETLFTRWKERREPQIAQAISESGYVVEAPLPLRIWSAVLSKREDIILASGAAAVPPLLDACDDADPMIADYAECMLTQLLEQTEVQEELCRQVIESDHPVARKFVLREHYVPHDIHQCALLYVLTQQWEKYEQSDIDRRVLSEMYPKLTSDIRKRLVASIRQSGRIEWIQVIVENRRKTPLREMSDDEWTDTIAMLKEQNAWGQAWRLAQTAPAERSIQLLSELHEVGWLPEHAVEQKIFTELTKLAEQCRADQIGLPEGVVPCRAVLEGHHDGVTCIVISSDGHLLASGGGKGAVHIWQLPKNAPPARQRTLITTFIYGQGESVLLDKVKGFGNELFDSLGMVLSESLNEHSSELFSDADIQYHGVSVNGLAISADGKRLIIASSDGPVWLWNISAQVELKRFGNRKGGSKKFGGSLIKMWDDNGLLIILSPSAIHQWRLLDDIILKTMKRGATHIERCHIISPDKKMLLCGNQDGTIRIWRLWDGVVLPVLETHVDPVECLAMSPDGLLLASGNQDSTIRLWRMPEGKLINILEGHTQPVTSVAISPDGNLLVSGSQDGTIHIWSLPDGRLLQTLAGHTDRISCLTISADEKMLASGCYNSPFLSNKIDTDDHTIRLWDLKWADLRRLSPDQLNVEDLKFIEKTLQQDKITESQQTWLEFLLVLARWQKRFDVEVGEATQGIPGGEFDVEIERNT